MDTRTGKANAVLRELYRSVVTKWELSNTAKLSVFILFFVPMLRYGHESLVMTERVISLSARGRYEVFAELTAWHFERKCAAMKFVRPLVVELFLLRLEISQLRCFGHLTRMSHERLARHVLLATSTGKRPRDRQRSKWSDYISDM